MRRFLKRLFYILILPIALLLAVATGVLYFFQKDIIKLVAKELEKNLATDVYVKKMELSLWSQFPRVSLDLLEPTIWEAVPESKDTLLSAERLSLTLDIIPLIKGETVINQCIAENGFARVRIDKKGQGNYNILKADTTQTKEESPVHFDLQKVILKDIDVSYRDDQNDQLYSLYSKYSEARLKKIYEVLDIGLQGTLRTKQIKVAGYRFLRNKPLEISCDLQYNGATGVLHFSPSILQFGPSEFKLEGIVHTGDRVRIDLSLDSQKGNIQTLLSLLPNQFSRHLKDYKSKGDVYFQARMKGNASGHSSPDIQVDFGFKNTSITHPESGLTIKKASLDGHYDNGSQRNAHSSSVSLKGIEATIGNKPFKGDFKLSNLNAPYIEASCFGTFELNELARLIPKEYLSSAIGTVDVQLDFEGKLKDLKSASRVDKVRTTGELIFSGVAMRLANPDLTVSEMNGNLLFNRRNLGISEITGKIGQSDFRLQGYFLNFFPYLLAEEPHMDIRASIASQNLHVDELINALNPPKDSTQMVELVENPEPFTLPSYLSLALECQADTFSFRKLTGEDEGHQLKGTLKLKEERLSFEQVSCEVAKGKISVDGFLNASADNYLQVKTKLDNIAIEKALFLLENFDQDFITDENIKGILHADADVRLPFDQFLNPNVNGLHARMDIAIDEGALVDFEPMMEVENFLKQKKYNKFLKDDRLSEITFKRLENTFQIANRTIFIPKMDIISSAQDITIQGTQTFDNKIDYDISFPIKNHARRNRLTEEGHQLQDSKGLRLDLKVFGTVDNFDFEVDKKALLKSTGEMLANSLTNTVKSDDQPEEQAIDLDTLETIH